jgi:PAS domain S-box-containing protein
MAVILDQEYLDNAVATTRSLSRARASGLALRDDADDVFSIRSIVGALPEGWSHTFCERVLAAKTQITEHADIGSPAVAQGVYIKRDTFDGVVFILFEPGTEFPESMLALLGHRFEFLIEIGMRANKYEAMQHLVPELSEKLQRVLSAVKMGIWEWDIDNNAVQWDDSMYRLYKRDPKDRENHFDRWMDALHPDDRPSIQMMMTAAIENPAANALNLRFRIYDDMGVMRHIVSKGKIFRDESGRAVHMSGVNIDVTEEETTSEKLHRVLHAVTVGIWEWDVVNDVLHADESMYSLYGIRKRSVLDSFASWIVVVHPDDREKMVRLVQTSEQDGSNFLETRFRITTDAGEIRHILSKGEIVRAADGRIVRMRGVNIDVTAEEKLIEKLHCVLNAGNIGIWEWDVVANHIEWDESMYRLYGKQSGVYADWLDSLHPDDRKIMDERTQMLLEDPQAETLELRFRVMRPGMPVRHVLGKADIQRDASGNALRMLGVNIDVTREEELLAEIQQNRDELKQLFDNMHEGVIIDDSDAIVVQCNPAAAKILRCQAASLIGKSAAEIGRRAIEDIGKPTAVEDLALYEVLRTGKSIIGKVSGMYLDSGELIWLRINVVPRFRPEDQTPYRLLVTFEDITEMRKYMASLNDEKARYENLVYGLNEAACVSMTDPDGRIMMINDKFVHLMGYPREELLGHTHRAMRSGIHTAEFCNQLWDTITDGKVWRGEFCNRTKSGKLVWLDTTIIPMLNAEGHVESYMSVRFDITAKREFEQQLYESREAEIRANNAKSEFLASMSHEIRTPMNGIIGMAQLLMDTDLTEEQRDCAQTIVSSGDLLLTIINDILDLSKIESGKIELDVRDFDLATYLRDLAKSFLPTVSKKSIVLRVETFSDRCFVRGDRERIGQIIMNLLGNAIKFTERGRVVLTLSRITDDIYTICVKDMGIGISEEAKGRLFTAFSQADRQIGKRFGGTGLGLVIAKKLTELMGGSINFFSAVGKGSTFIVTLSLAPGIPPVKTSMPVEQIVEVDPDALVLVAEDNVVNQKIVSRMLSKIGCKMKIVDNGAQAVTSANDASLILMDCQMPIMDGYEATRALRNSGFGKPIVALTANALSGDAEKCILSGMDDYLSKPIKLRTLTDMLVKYIPKNKRPMQRGASPSHIFSIPPTPQPPQLPQLPQMPPTQAMQTVQMAQPTQPILPLP